MSLGDSKAFAIVHGSLEQPYAGRPSEGSVKFQVGMPKCQYGMLETTLGTACDSMRASQYLVELGRFVERSMRESKSIDLESLCVQAGRRVWHLYVDVSVLNVDGNIADVVGLAALGVLRVYKRPEVTLDAMLPGGLKVHSLEDREGVPLTMHHVPVSVSFAYFDQGRMTIVDPTMVEEAGAEGRFTVSVTPQGELCAAQKATGYGVSQPEIMRCLRMATEKAREMCEILDKAVKSHGIARVSARVRRHTVRQYGGRQVGDQIEPVEVPELIQQAMQVADEPMEEMPEEKEEAKEGPVGPPAHNLNVGTETEGAEDEGIADYVAATAPPERKYRDTSCKSKKKRKGEVFRVAATKAAAGGGIDNGDSIASAFK